jgi:hypothetical protein
MKAQGGITHTHTYIHTHTQTKFVPGNLNTNKRIVAMKAQGGITYMGGDFSEAGNATAHSIISWDGSRAKGLGFGTDGGVYAIEIYQGRVVAGGTFSKVYQRAGGGVYTGGLAVWDLVGASWGVLGAPLQGSVYAIAADGSNLYVGGKFNQFVATTFNGIARFDGAVWTPLISAGGVGVEGGEVTALAVSYPYVYVGGSFTRAGGMQALRLARWDTQKNTWTSIGSMDGNVMALAAYGRKLFAGGAFLSASGDYMGGVGLYMEDPLGNVGTWQAMGKGVQGYVHALGYSMEEDCVYVGGAFTAVSDARGTRPAQRCVCLSVCVHGVYDLWIILLT